MGGKDSCSKGSLQGNNIASVSNTVVRASYNLNVTEKRLIIAGISMIEPGDIIDESTVFTIDIGKYADIFGLEAKEAKRDILKAVDTLFDKKIDIIDTIDTELHKTKTTTFHWLDSKVVYKKGESVDKVEIIFSRQIIPYISELKKNFTKVRLSQIQGLTSFYHIRIYEWIVEQRGLTKKRSGFKISLVDLRFLLGIPDNEYKTFNMLSSKILIPALKALDKHTDAKGLGWEYIKEGRKVVGLEVW